MTDYKRPAIEYTPLEIGNSLRGVDLTEEMSLDSDIVVDKLMAHLDTIKEFYDRLDAIDYLADNAAKLAGNTKYTTSDDSIIKGISTLGGYNNVVDFDLFKKAIDIVLEGYKQMALVQLTGVKNGGH